ncbi:type VII secretion-associated serine protease mycosin [Kitasatospora sp. MAP5-34]|uniref:type VII secretion-associated serine protease mycosin n=1 Tax=Kitasatospora sp. MAP5-34 TaxID=3035102 RepID=UPI0024763B44|nr:type VII secretion-associated serine protease mycosin [Kitasatospora sp. MAP5-34]MDH6579648.1 type VII secretion-associated serine protease mycosin [Kitasatospora sp. MAP5-34]
MPSLGTYRRATAAFVALGVVGGLAATPAYADSPSPSAATRWTPMGIAAAAECAIPSTNVVSVPWALQRVVLSQLWAPHKPQSTATTTGAGVTVAVIDTGVDNTNPQLAGKVIDGGSSLVDQSTGQAVPGNGTTDTVGHGTKVAGIIAARVYDKTGFVGLAPDANIFSIRQNDAQGNGSVQKLTDAVNEAVDHNVQVINISQDVRGTDDTGQGFVGKADLQKALTRAENAGIVVVASSGNDGLEGATYPAAFDTVLAVGASDRNNERASFSQYGDFVGVAAPGVDMLSTAPILGQCVDNGTSFSSPYVAGVAALLKGEHPDWTAKQVRARIEQTAQRTQRGWNKFTGWGVVDPVKAVQWVDNPPDTAHDDPPVQLDSARIVAQPLGLAETQADRDRRSAMYVMALGALLVAGLAGGSVVLRDRRRRDEA